jgi:hypothetical protein
MLCDDEVQPTPEENREQPLRPVVLCQGLGGSFDVVVVGKDWTIAS